MNLRKWSSEHTLGLLMGIFTPLICVPIAMLIYGFFDGKDFAELWERFTILYDDRSKFISLGCIGNLIFFHLSIRKQKYDRAMGLILSVFAYLFLVMYYKFLA